MKAIIYLLLSLLFFSYLSAQEFERIDVSDDIYLLKTSKNTFAHISFTEVNGYGRIPSDGLIFIDGNKAFLFDTPMEESLTKTLVAYLKDSMGVETTGFAANHFHDDCIAGLSYLHSIGVESYANEMTIEICKREGLTVPKHGFKDSLIINLNNKKIILSYHGPAHASDNIAAYIPSEKVLFAGCMAKELSSNSKGNIADANLTEWPKTMQKVLNAYPDAVVVIPGHGKPGGKELLTHTIEIFSK